jgi:Protein of unknown function (DUF2786)
MTTQREGLLDKIRGLLAKTLENGCTESEAMAALDKAHAMMAAYDVSENELSLTKEEKAILRREPPGTKDPHRIKWFLLSSNRQAPNRGRSGQGRSPRGDQGLRAGMHRADQRTSRQTERTIDGRRYIECEGARGGQGPSHSSQARRTWDPALRGQWVVRGVRCLKLPSGQGSW